MYSKMSIYYDQIFPLKEETLSFLKDYLPQGKIHDLACGTGSYGIALNGDEYNVTASDLDDSMIEAAIRKRRGKYPIFEVQNMLSFREDENYNGIYLIGNSLVHLSTYHDVEKLCYSIYHSLQKNGTFIIQIVNYDRIYDQRIETLPTIKTNDLTFERLYHIKEDVVEFETILTSRNDVLRGIATLLPIRPTKLNAILEKVGFIIGKSFGSFQENPFDSTSSFHYIVVAQK